MKLVVALPCLALLLAACDGEAPKSNDPPPEPAKKVEAPPPEEKKPEPPPAPKFPPGEPDEACAKILVVAWAEAEGAEGITRDKQAAFDRAKELRTKLVAGTAFADLAGETDEPKTKAKGGAMGTYAKDKWPEKYAPLKDVVFKLGIGETGEIVEHPHGLVIPQRCAVEKVHSRHILVRYKGAKNAEPKIKRSKDDARKLAEKIQAEAAKPGADFEALAKKKSEDSSAERGGDLGSVGRGMFAPAYEAAAFALQPGQISAVVESDFGFHVIQRVE